MSSSAQLQLPGPERWKPIPKFSAYEISTNFRVRRRATGKILKPWRVGNYWAVSLRAKNQTRKLLVARLYCKVFCDLKKGQQVNHRRMRTSSRAEIVRGMRGRANHSSQFKGVSYDTRHKKFFACIKIDRRTVAIGSFVDEIVAAKSYDRAAFAAWGEFAFLNFPTAEASA